MSKLERITVTLPEKMAARLRDMVEAGEYATTSEIVREALRGWSLDQERRALALSELRAEIEKGLKGPFLDGPSAMADMRAKYAARAECDDGL